MIDARHLQTRIKQALTDHQSAIEQFVKEHDTEIIRASIEMRQSLATGGKIYACGNGGSATDASHFCGELLGRFHKERRPLAAQCLTTDPSTITAIANDYGYTEVFARQVQALVRPADFLVAISTSGNSENVLKAALMSKELGATLITVTGGSGGKLGNLGKFNFNVGFTNEVARIQECHIFLLHMLCDLMDT